MTSGSLPRDECTKRKATTTMIASKDGSAETMMPPRQDHRQFAYPAWPTSMPGPEATLPPLGQKPHPTRTDQMMYEEPYDQERGRAGFSLPAPIIPEQAAPESRGLTKRAGRLDPFGRLGHA